MEIIKINNITKNYKNIKALNNLSLSINEGELYVPKGYCKGIQAKSLKYLQQ